MDHNSKIIDIFSVGQKYSFRLKKFYCRVHNNIILIPALIQGKERK
jgi:hypothetical protein